MNKLLNKISNLKCYKKLLAMLTAGMMFATPVAGLSESNESEKTNESSYELVMQNKDVAPMTIEEFKLLVKHANEYLKERIDYNTMLNDLQCMEYLMNREYMTDDDAKELESGYVHGTDIANGEYQNFVDAYHLINEILDYNQSVIKNFDRIIDINKITYKEYDKVLLNYFLYKVVNDKNYNLLDAIRDYNAQVEEMDFEKVIETDDICIGSDSRLSKYLNKVIDENYDLKKAIGEYNLELTSDMAKKLIDISELCYDSNDKKLAHEIFMNYVSAYAAGKFDNEYFRMVFKQITTLNSEEKAGNGHQLSVGARWASDNVNGGDVMQMLRDHMQETYSRKELDKFFDKEELNRHQWIIRNDASFNINAPESELEDEVLKFGELWTIVYTNVNNNIMNLFAEKCSKLDK